MLLVSLQAGELRGQLLHLLLKRIGRSNLLLQEPDLHKETLLSTIVFFRMRAVQTRIVFLLLVS